MRFEEVVTAAAMAKFKNKTAHAAHIKKHTVGTSNEISLSVLDAAKNRLDGEKANETKLPKFGGVALFTMPWSGRLGRRKKPAATPVKEKGLPLSDGGFASAENLGQKVNPSDTLNFSRAGGSEGSSGGVRGGATGTGVVSGIASGTTSGAPSGTASSITSSITSGTASGVTSGKVAGGASRGASSTRGLAGRTMVDGSQAGRTSKAGWGAGAFSKTSKPEFGHRSPEEEIAYRKLRRRRHKRLALSCAIVVVLGSIGVGGYYFYQEITHHNEQVSQLDTTLASIRQADEVVLALDNIVVDPFSSTSASAANSVLDKVPAARTQLEDASESLWSVAGSINDSKGKEAAHQAIAAVSARLSLLDSGEAIIREAQSASSGIALVEKAWDSVLTGDSAARSAAQLVTDTTEEHVRASREKSVEAQTAFTTAQSLIAQAQAAYPSADIASLESYVDKRVEACSYAIASDDAFLARDKEAASQQNDAYNKADAEAAALAKDFPDDPAQLIRDAFAAQVADQQESYATARLQAGSADAFIRDYLGT